MNITVTEKINKIKVDRPEVLAGILRDILSFESVHDQYKEHFWGVYLDSRKIIKGIELITLGILDASLVHPREVFAPAISNHAVALIIAHNHPSGSTEASEADLLITKRLKEAGELLGITLLDHIIITLNNGYFSFKNRNLI